MSYALSVFEQREYMTADEWACNNRIMLSTNRLFSYIDTPYLREPTRAFCDIASNYKVVLSCCAQTGKTTAIENCLAWIALYHPKPTLIIFDTKNNSRDFSKTRLRPFLRDQVRLSAFDESTAENRKQDKYKDCFLYSLAPGASLMLGGSTSASDLCSRPVAFLICDEVDRFVDQLAGEGDPLMLAEKRQMRFRDSMALYCSTPTTPQNRITRQYELGTAEEWGCVCTRCKSWFAVRYGGILWDDTPTVACITCGQRYSEQEIIRLEHRYSDPQNPTPTTDRFGRIARSFRITAPLVHAFYSWDFLRTQERNARRLGEGAVQTWQNTTIGEPYVSPQEARIDPGAFADRLCEYDSQTLPAWVFRIVGGADTQDNAIFCELIGISEDGQRVCGIEYRIFKGDPAQLPVWSLYLDWVNSFVGRTVDGRALTVTCIMQDSGGHHTQTVYSMSLANPRLKPCKGRSYTTDGTKEERAILDRMTTRTCVIGHTKTRIPLIHVGTVYAKDIILARANEVIYSDDYTKERWCWPNGIDSGYDFAYFQSLLSNVCIYTEKGHRYSLVEGQHDEALDCRVYALAAYELVKMYMGKLPAVEIVKSQRPADNASQEQTQLQPQRQDPVTQTVPQPQSAPTLQLQPNDPPKIIIPRRRLKPL